LQITERRKTNMQRKIKLLGAILVFALIVSAAAMVGATWTDNSIVKLTSSTATDSFTTTVVGVATNAVETPIDINGVYYTSSNIATFAPPVQSGDPNHPSTVEISASGFVPGDYAVFQVTIKNTGSATLAFTNYEYADNFIDSLGNKIAYTFPSNDLYQPGYTTTIHGPYSQAFSANWDTSTSVSAMTTIFQNYLTNNAAAGCASTWCQDNAFIGTTLPTTLAPGATFVYYIYTGLGVDTIYGIPSCLYSVTIPLVAAQ
jgi:hypothetical protein